MIGRILRNIVTSNLAARITANPLGQRVLGRIVADAQYLRGIGSGTSPETSGERALLKLLRTQEHADGQPLCLFDVGANQGQFTLVALAELQGLPLRIHAFEPARRTFAKLRTAIGTRADVELNNFALGERVGKTTLYYDTEGSGLASRSRRNLDFRNISFDKSETVRIDTLTRYCRRRRIRTIDLLKMDVEGHELDVLRGGAEMLRTRAVRMVSFEFGGCNLDSRTFVRDFFDFFRQYGTFELYRITPSGYLASVGGYSEMLEQFTTTVFAARCTSL